MDLDFFTTVGGDDESFAAFAIKGFDNSCHFTGQTNSLLKYCAALYGFKKIKPAIFKTAGRLK